VLPGRTAIYPWNESARKKIGRYKDTSTNATKMSIRINLSRSGVILLEERTRQFMT